MPSEMNLELREMWFEILTKPLGFGRKGAFEEVPNSGCRRFEGVPVVERGDRVLLVLEDGPLRIQATGRAQESGVVGEWIRVRNLDSKRELSGRVDREGRIHVAF